MHENISDTEIGRPAMPFNLPSKQRCDRAHEQQHYVAFLTELGAFYESGRVSSVSYDSEARLAIATPTICQVAVRDEVPECPDTN